MSRPVVLRSIEDASGDRCVDIVREGDAFFWVECRRDPEDNHGWRHMGAASEAFVTEPDALEAARRTVGWMDAP